MISGRHIPRGTALPWRAILSCAKFRNSIIPAQQRVTAKGGEIDMGPAARPSQPIENFAASTILNNQYLAGVNIHSGFLKSQGKCMVYAADVYPDR
jgi:hypothetical protein